MKLFYNKASDRTVTLSYVLSLLLNLNTRSIRNRTEKLTKLTFSQPSSRLHQSRTTQSTTLPFDAITENGTVPPGTGSTYELHDFEAKGKAEGGSIGGYSDIHVRRLTVAANYMVRSDRLLMQLTIQDG